jgi:hypothetical protein
MGAASSGAQCIMKLLRRQLDKRALSPRLIAADTG